MSAANGTSENTDYDQSGFPKTVTFAAGDGNGDTQTVAIDPASDTLIEGDETVMLAIVNGVLLTGSGQTSNVVTITDADTATVAFQSATTTVGEDDASATDITLVLSTTRASVGPALPVRPGQRCSPLAVSHGCDAELNAVGGAPGSCP